MLMDIELFKTITKMSQTNLTCSLLKVLTKKYGEKNITLYDNNIFAKGTVPITLIAHLDTVFLHPPVDFYYDQEQKVLWSPDGLGADDRAGVYAILEIISKTKNNKPSVLFCRDEETGCLGATSFVEKFKSPLTETKYLIELDRRGKNDCVFYDTDNPEFIKYIESFGFKEASGTYSDVLEIGSAWKVPGTNLSVGYYDEHSHAEHLKVEELEDTIRKVVKMINEKNIPNFEYIPKISLNKCSFCGGSMTVFEDYVIRTENKKNPYKHVCPSCLGTREDIQWCPICQTPFIGSHEVCPKCYEEEMKKINVV